MLRPMKLQQRNTINYLRFVPRLHLQRIMMKNVILGTFRDWNLFIRDSLLFQEL